jgi:hypothetical protein
MSEFEDIQRLIRLKRHERPSADFVEHFVSTFQERQRSEMLRNSARGLLWERVTTYFDGLINPKWAWAGVTAMAMFGLGFMLRPAASSGSLAQNPSAKQTPLIINASEAQAAGYQINHNSPLSVDVGRNLISRNYGGGLGDEPLLTGSPSQLGAFRLDLESH